MAKRRGWAVWLYLLLYLALTVTMAASQPLSDPVNGTAPPDEAARYLIPQYIFRHGTLPTGLEEEVRIPAYGFSYGLYNTFPYILMGLAMRLAGLFTQDPGALLLAARTVNVLSGLAMAAVVYRLSRLLFRREAAAWLFCALVTFQPMNLFVHSYVNTDSFCLLSAALITLGMVRMCRRGAPDVRSCLDLAAGVILCALSYYSAYGYILCAALFFLILFIRKEKPRYDWKGMLKWAVPTALLAVAGTAWWFIRQAVVLDGDFLGLRTREQLALRYALPEVSPLNTYQARGVSFFAMLGDMMARGFPAKIAGTLIAAYGSLSIEPGLVYYILFALVWAAGLAGCFPALRRAVREGRSFRQWFFHGCMLVCILLPGVLLLRYCYTMDYQEQGRYLLPALVPAMMYIARGLETLTEKIMKEKAGRLLTACALMMVLLACYQVFAVALPRWL